MQTISDLKQGMTGLSLKQEERLLLSCMGAFIERPACESTLPPPSSGIDWERFLALGRSHNLLPLLAYFSEKDSISPRIPETFIERLDETYRWSIHHNALLQGHLRSVLSAFRDQGVPVIVLKGAAIAERLYPHLGLRPMIDIDIMVQQSDVFQAQSILEDVGFDGPKTQILEDLFLQHHHHLAPRIHRTTGAMIELHWQLTRPDHPYNLDMQEMWANALEVFLTGIPCWELDPIDQLIHLCVHYMGDRLGKKPGGFLQLLDIGLFLKMYQDSISWTKFIERAIRYQTSSEVFSGLYISRLILGVSYPVEIDTDLRPENFDAENIEPFLIHRVIGRGSDIPISLIHCLSSPSRTGKLRALLQMLKTPESWSPGAGGTRTHRPSKSRFNIFSLPARSMAALRVLVSQGRQVRGQLIAERWVTQFLDGRSNVELESSHQ